MYYYEARFYSYKLGRFLQTDPIGYEDQFNLYAYVGNDPINGIDPSGMISAPACTGSRVCSGNAAGLASGLSGTSSVSARGSWTDRDRADAAANESSSSASHGTSGQNQSGLSDSLKEVNENISLVRLVAWLASQVTKRSVDAEVADIEWAVLNPLTALGEVAPALPTAAIARVPTATVQFGRVPNQVSHTFRHVRESGYNSGAIGGAILRDLQGVNVPLGTTLTRSVTVSGRTFQYNAHGLEKGLVNVGRIVLP